MQFEGLRKTAGKANGYGSLLTEVTESFHLLPLQRRLCWGTSIVIVRIGTRDGRGCQLRQCPMQAVPRTVAVVTRHTVRVHTTEALLGRNAFQVGPYTVMQVNIFKTVALIGSRSAGEAAFPAHCQMLDRIGQLIDHGARMLIQVTYGGRTGTQMWTTHHTDGHHVYLGTTTTVLLTRCRHCHRAEEYIGK
jgi:hypothetical protein